MEIIKESGVISKEINLESKNLEDLLRCSLALIHFSILLYGMKDTLRFESNTLEVLAEASKLCNTLRSCKPAVGN